MSTKQNKQRPNKLKDLTDITNWLVGNNKSEIDKDRLFKREYKFNLFNYILKHPKLIYYVDKYLNNIYDFEKYTDEEWFTTFKKLLSDYGIKNSNQLYFAKYKPPKRSLIKQEFREYLIDQRIPSENELNDLYRLYDTKIITDQHISQLKTINSGEESKQYSNISPPVTTPSDSNSIVSSTLMGFNSSISRHINTRLTCKNCPLFGKEKQPIYTDLKLDDGQVDVIIVTEKPYDINEDSPIKYIIALAKQLELTYIMTSLVLCKPDGPEIPNSKKTILNCKNVTNYVYNTFSSNIKILLGTKAKQTFGIRGNMNQLNGSIINDCFILVDPITSMPLYKSGFVKLKEELTKLNKRKSISKQTNTNSTIDYNQLENYTLFDVKTMDEQILYILIENGTGNKKYITENISYPVYIKQGQFRECDHIIDNPDIVTYLTHDNKQYLTNLLRKNMYNVVGNPG